MIQSISIFSFNLTNLVFVLLCNLTFAQSEPPAIRLSPPDRSHESVTSRLSIDARIGQLLTIGISGTQLTTSSRQIIRDVRPGGIILFGRNIKSHEQVARLNNSIHLEVCKATGVPPLIMVDQEGGRVARVRTQPHLPSPLAMSASRSNALIERFGVVTGHLLTSLGFTMNLAPVLDISSPDHADFIGNRSFGADPETVSRHATAFAKGLKASKVIPTAKHFPGHGNMTQDSHQVTPRKLLSLEELKAKDLIPYESFIKLVGDGAILVSHVAFPNLDPSGLPAAFSPFMIETLLRGQLGFDGLVFTDDLEMNGADVIGTVGDRSLTAFLAGNDLVMVAWTPHHQQTAFRALRQGLADGRITLDRLNHSLRRIAQAKAHLSCDRPPALVSSKEIRDIILHSNAQLRELVSEVKRATFLNASQDIDFSEILSDTDGPILIFSADARFESAFRQKFARPLRYYALSPKKADPTLAAFRKHPHALGVYYVSGDQTARRVNQLPNNIKRQLVLVNTLHAGAITQSHQFRAVVQMNTLSHESGAWLADAIKNRSPAQSPSHSPH